MNKVSLYTEKKQEFSEIAFVKDTHHQVKIRDITNSYEFLKAFEIWVTSIGFKLGIKEDVDDALRADVKELINMRFKSLSLDELYYAFKLERFGVYGDKTAHYQSFNADYVSTILDKYTEWKRLVKVTHNISAKKDSNELSEEQIRFLENRAVTKAIQLFEETQNVTSDYTHLYEFFLEKGFINPTNEEKKKYYEDSKEILEMELKELKPTSREESKEIKNFLSGLQKNKNPKVISKSKELIVTAYFRKLRRENELENFKLKFKNQ